MEIEVIETSRGLRFLWVHNPRTWGIPTEYIVDILSAPKSCDGEEIRHHRSDDSLVKSGRIRWDGPREEHMPKFCWGGNSPFLEATTKQFQTGDKLIISPLEGKPAGRNFEMRLWLEMTHEIEMTWGVKNLYEEPPEDDDSTDELP